MEIQLQELIDQIKKDGVEVAQNEADAILKAAREEAEKIVNDAKLQADKIISNAKIENERMVRASEDAIRQAGRNLLISFRESVTRELNAILNQNVTAVYSSEGLAQIIIKVVQAWADKPEAEDIAVILNTETIKEFEAVMLAKFKENALNGITLKANDNFDGGFRIAVNNSGAYYDYSTDAVVQMLSNYLSPKVSKLLKEAE